MYSKGRWTFRNCSSSHRVLMPEMLSAGCGYFQQWPHAPGTPQKMWSVWSGVTQAMPEARSCWVVSTVMGADSKWVTHCRVVWATSGGSCIEEATRSTSRRWNTGAAGGVAYGRKYWGRYCPTPGTYITNISAQEGTSSCQQFHHGRFTFWYFFIK